MTKQTSITVRAHLETTVATVAFPGTLSATIDGVTMFTLNATSAGANDFSGNTPPLTHGQHSVTASYPDASLVSLPVSFTIDTLGPNLTLLSGIPAADFKRDELFTLAVNADETIQSPVVTIGDATMQSATGACSGTAGCWTLDMSAPTLNSLEGNVTVVVRASDAVGNNTVFDAGTVHITRKRWDVQPIAEEIRAAPAIGRDGTIYFGTRTSATAGNLIALNPVTGAQSSQPAAIGAMISVATGVSTADAGLVYFTANDTTGGATGARTDMLTSPASVNGITRGTATARTFSALALVGNGTEVGAVSAFNSIITGTVPGSVVVYWPTSLPRSNTAPPSPFNALDFALVPNPVEVANNIIINNGTTYLSTRQSGVGMKLVPVTGADTTTPTVGTATDIETGGNDCCLAGQASLGTGSLLGGHNLARKLYSLNPTLVSGNLGTAVDNGLPAVASSTRAFVGRGNDLIAFDPSSLSSTGIALKSGAGSIRTSPVLGAARAGQSTALGYAVNSSGQLFVFDQDSAVTGSAHDFGTVFSATTSTVYAHPTLDCNRRAGAATATTGILYVTNADGRVAAIIVDSPQLSRTASWPKYQRTAGNAGNTDSRFPLNPGCPGN